MGEEGRFLALLRRPDLGSSELESILRDPAARRFHAVRLALASHRHTPRGEALSLVETLYSHDLALLSADVRAQPEVRRAADRQILRRISEMALAERIHLARTAGRGTLGELRHDPEPRVVAACLDNRFATEADVLAVIGPQARPEALAAVVNHPRWRLRRPVREALLHHPGFPAAAMEALLDGATGEDLPPGGTRPAFRPLFARRRKESLRVARRGTSIESINGPKKNTESISTDGKYSTVGP